MLNISKKRYLQYMYSYPHKTAYRPLPDISIIPYLSNISGEVELYVHLPFCETKCGYCNLFSISPAHSNTIELYINAIERQCEQYLPHLNKLKITSVTLGGGTPLCLNIAQLLKLLNILEDKFSVDLKTADFIIETSPRQTDQQKLQLLKDKGLRRISLGIQSFIDSELETIHRKHTYKFIINSIQNIKQIGFETINFDIIYGIPQQTNENLEFSLQKALEFQPDEIFMYPLYNKINTPNFKKFQIDESSQYNLYLVGRDYLQSHGYEQISMRRFVKKVGNAISCGFGNTISLGAGGRSYIGDLHFCSAFSTLPSKIKTIIQNFIQKNNFLHVENGFILNENEQKRRFVIKNLLHTAGIDRSLFKNIFNSDVLTDFGVFSEIYAENFVEITENRIQLTPEGLSWSDYLGTLFISPEVANLMQTFKDE